MFAKFLRQAGAALAAGAAALALTATPALADKASEAYVQTNAQSVLTQLNSADNAAERQAKFGALMDTFADMPRIADFVLGRYARNARADKALYQEWLTTFRNYAVAVYEDQLDQYRGRSIKVLPGSQDAVINGRTYSVVRSEIATPSGQPFLVNWRLIQTPQKTWKVVDVAVNLDGNVIWLAIQQRQDFLSKLDKNGGDIRKLIADVKAQTAAMRARTASRRGA